VRRTRVAGLLVAVAAAALAVAIAAGSLSRDSLTSTASLPSAMLERSTVAAVAGGPPRDPGSAGLGAADGAVAGGVTVFDDAVPGVARLDPALLGALRRAAIAARADGVTFVVDSGWRSPEYQEGLLQAAISEYGSAQEAARWVARPEVSEHVSGDAVDLARAAAAWLAEHGAAYGLCRIYANEAWHYELRPEAVGHGCPPTYADPTDDPRMHR
jgi:D-alanyl-D-alanine carboxypeptidase